MSNFEAEIRAAVARAVKDVYDLEPDEKILSVETPRDPKMGDYSTSVAMRLARTLHKAPMDIAMPLVENLKANYDGAESVEAVKPGFINFRMKASALSSVINTVLAQGDNWGKNNAGNGKKVLVEYVSANPTGDLHCGHARGAAWGDALTRVMKASGYDVLREYYVNDAGHQIDMLAESILSRYYELFGQSYPLPEEGYHAQDIVEVAKKIKEKDGDKWLHEDGEKRLDYFKDEGIEMKLDAIRKDLDLFRVHFDSWMHERFFYENNAARIQKVLDTMTEKGLTYEKDGALWFKSSEFGDDKDRVLRKSTGLLTYLTPDIANHVYKYERGYDTLIDLWGADHHSYVTRMKCALKALGYNPDSLIVDLIQMVRMVDNGVEVKMSKRTGNAITIRELCEDVGVDAARWFFVSKDVSTQMDFDMNLARKKDNDNPVYYAQYAYSRMNSIVTREDVPAFHQEASYDRLQDEKELLLLKMISEFPQEVANAAKTRKPNRIADYILSFVRVFHSYYNASRVYNPDDLELTNQRLGLIHASMITLKNALDLIGVSAPEKM
ncbi:MAG: arginine--tRNA ligase [Lactimicrobium sp.]|jgi:arginyl-tRNA synthetase|uniref:arginine--tRNA ligase n=1 Tax=Lactimicrobium sp. TaxID=2563780 RepID=UPI002F35A227